MNQDSIAIVGLACRFPGAPDARAFWKLLASGIDAIGEVPPDRWDKDVRMYARWGGFLPEVDRFDPVFFGLQPKEAEAMDPQQRLALEVAFEAIQDAGYAPSALKGQKGGVFVGISASDYYQLLLRSGRSPEALMTTGNAHSVVANRISYLLDLRGPSLAVDTACSSSLVAMHLAIGSLRRGESDVAIAGGVNLILTPEISMAFCQAEMMSKDGRCKAFDARADGFVRGEGCGMLLLKRLDDAERAGDPIWAVIRGSGVNHDGRSNGLTAPSGPAQEAVIKAAIEDAKVDAKDVAYVEAHGSSTSIGDAIELGALARVFGKARVPPLVVGSVKTNIGTLEAASGAAEMIKVVLALSRGTIPMNLHFREPNATLLGAPISIPTASTPWPEGAPKIAGVSSFGLGGTNAHVVVEAAPSSNDRDERDESKARVLALSARSPELLRREAAILAEVLKAEPELGIADACFTRNVGRTALPRRAAFVAASLSDLTDRLSAFASGDEGARAFVGEKKTLKSPKVGFVFRGTGGGSFSHAVFDGASARLLERLGGARGPHAERFVFESALAEFWRAIGVQPSFVTGEGVGALAALVTAGSMSLDDAVARLEAWTDGERVTPPAPPSNAKVRWVDGPQAALDAGAEILLKMGPGEVVTESIAKLWAAGVEIDWKELEAPRRARRVRLPPLPYERQRLWCAPPNAIHRQGPRSFLDEIAQGARSTPDREALIDGDGVITYARLLQHAHEISRRIDALESAKSGTDLFVAIEGPAKTIVALLGALLSKRSTTVMHPDYPRQLPADAFILTERALAPRFVDHLGTRLVVEEIPPGEPGDWPSVEAKDVALTIDEWVSADEVKTRRLDHQDVLEFFATFDRSLGSTEDRPLRWLSVLDVRSTGSILGILRALVRGDTIVFDSLEPDVSHDPRKGRLSEMEFSLFFGQDDGASGRYDLLLDSARFADENDFSAIWIAEHHFHEVGRLYPRPSIAAAAVAAMTRRLRIRGANLPLPLHETIRVAEEWSMLDRLSNGRVDVGVDAGLFAEEFAFFPERFSDRETKLFSDLASLRRLLRGEAIPTKSHDGNDVSIVLEPKPIQSDVPLWIAAGCQESRHVAAGELGLNVLTPIAALPFRDLTERIKLYRRKRAEAKHEGPGKVTLSLHALLGKDTQEVRTIVDRPLTKQIVAFSEQIVTDTVEAWNIDAAQLRRLAHLAVDKYFGRNGLFGRPEELVERVEALQSIGVDELACIVDFGVAPDTVRAALPWLNALRRLCRSDGRSVARIAPSIAVDRIQCPDHALEALLGRRSRAAWASVSRIVVTRKTEEESAVRIKVERFLPGAELAFLGRSEAQAQPIMRPVAPPAIPKEYVAPKNETERTLADIWAAVLVLPKVSAEDNFFEIGGDSRLGLEIVARAKSAGMPFEAVELFEHPTIVDLATHLMTRITPRVADHAARELPK
jgi:natural product biosynthesis luciferase-like monooxygenase protein